MVAICLGTTGNPWCGTSSIFRFEEDGLPSRDETAHKNRKISFFRAETDVFLFLDDV
jgi:hypothetical protein